MELYSFVQNSPAASISAEQLDKNFRRLRPLRADGTSAKQYLLTESPNGWALQIFPNFPNNGALHVLGFQSGRLLWVSTSECL